MDNQQLPPAPNEEIAGNPEPVAPVIVPAPPPPRPRKILPEVPEPIRKRIQAMLLLRSNEVGCWVTSIGDRYKQFYGETIDPRQLGHDSWMSVLRSMKNEVKIKKVNGVFAVFGEECSTDDWMQYSRRLASYIDTEPQETETRFRPTDFEEIADDPLGRDWLLSLIGESPGQDPTDVSNAKNGVELPGTSQNPQETQPIRVADQGNTRVTKSPDTTAKPPEPAAVEQADTSCVTGSIEQPCSSRSVNGSFNNNREPLDEVAIVCEIPSDSNKKPIEYITIDDSDDDDSKKNADEKPAIKRAKVKAVNGLHPRSSLSTISSVSSKKVPRAIGTSQPKTLPLTPKTLASGIGMRNSASTTRNVVDETTASKETNVEINKASVALPKNSTAGRSPLVAKRTRRYPPHPKHIANATGETPNGPPNKRPTTINSTQNIMECVGDDQNMTSDLNSSNQPTASSFPTTGPQNEEVLQNCTTQSSVYVYGVPKDKFREYSSCRVVLTRLKKSEIPVQKSRKGRKRKISEVSDTGSDISNSGQRNIPMLRSRVSRLPSVEELAEVVRRPEQLWFTTKFREDVDGDQCATFQDYMEYTDILRPPGCEEEESYFKTFTKQYYFVISDTIKEELDLLEDARVEWNDEAGRGFYFNPVSSLCVEYSVSDEVEEIVLDDNENKKVPMMNFESFQIANLDADCNVSEIPGSGEILTVVTSYGNFADYLMWKWGNRCHCISFTPALGQGSTKLRRAGGVSYVNFYCFENGVVDIFNPEVTEGFCNYMKDLALADLFIANGIGDDDVKGRPQDLALAQSMLALEVVRERGTFVLKVNDTFTDFSVGLIFYLSRCFNYVTIVKPTSALPGERFIVCREKRPAKKCDLIKNYLKRCHIYRVENNWLDTDSYLDKIFGGKDGDPTSSYLQEVDKDFLLRIKMWNTQIANIERREYDLFCLKRNFWTVSSPSDRYRLQDVFRRVRNNHIISWDLNNVPNGQPNGELIADVPVPASELTEIVEKTVSNSVDTQWISGGRNNWKAIFTCSPLQRYIIFANSEGCHKWEGMWKPVERLRLPEGTVLYAEIFPASKSRPSILNIIDVKQWGRESFNGLKHNERIRRCQSLATQASNQDYWISFPHEFDINELPCLISALPTNCKFKKSYVQGLDDKLRASTKNSSQGNADFGFCTNGILFLQCDNLPQSNSQSTDDSNSDFSYVVSHRLLWEWRSTEILNHVSEGLRHIHGSYNGQDHSDMVEIIQYLASV